jgi:hypothetical protein
MQLRSIDIVGGTELVDPFDQDASVVTGVDDPLPVLRDGRHGGASHGRAVALAFAHAVGRFGVPEEMISNNGNNSPTGSGRAARRCSTRSAAPTASPTLTAPS